MAAAPASAAAASRAAAAEASDFGAPARALAVRAEAVAAQRGRWRSFRRPPARGASRRALGHRVARRRCLPPGQQPPAARLLAVLALRCTALEGSLPTLPGGGAPQRRSWSAPAAQARRRKLRTDPGKTPGRPYPRVLPPQPHKVLQAPPPQVEAALAAEAAGLQAAAASQPAGQAAALLAVERSVAAAQDRGGPPLEDALFQRCAAARRRPRCPPRRPGGSPCRGCPGSAKWAAAGSWAAA
mmetsp:Transcript_34795/g.111765  ORF Transcript_34795/g.111765 Transcript_34795/m.111765 type:complete len:242 (-) Transcript_34795:114-839(-)